MDLARSRSGVWPRTMLSAKPADLQAVSLLQELRPTLEYAGSFSQNVIGTGASCRSGTRFASLHHQLPRHRCTRAIHACLVPSSQLFLHSVVVCVQRRQRSRSDVRVDLVRCLRITHAHAAPTGHPTHLPSTLSTSPCTHPSLVPGAQMPCLQLSWEWLQAPDSFLVYILECCSKCLCPRCLCFVCSCEHLVRSICCRLMCSLRVLFWSSGRLHRRPQASRHAGSRRVPGLSHAPTQTHRIPVPPHPPCPPRLP